MATEVPANEHPARDRHQLQTLILAVTLLLTALLAVLVVIASASWLNRYGFGHFPLGFYFLPGPAHLHRRRGVLVLSASRSASIWRGANARGSNDPVPPAHAKPASWRLLRHRHQRLRLLVIILAMFEQLGWGRPLLAQSMMFVPLALYLLIAVGARTFEVEDYFVSGRRVPPVFNGFALAAVAVGGVGFLAYTGTVFFLGFDASPSGLAGPSACCSPPSCSCPICARPAPIPCRVSSAIAFARAACAWRPA